jgi:hypothetical protein
LDLEASIFDLGEHFLDGANFADDVQVISTIHVLMERAGKLLSWMNKGVDLDIIYLKGPGQSVGFALEHLECRFDHVLLELCVDNLYLGGGCIVQF